MLKLCSLNFESACTNMNLSMRKKKIHFVAKLLENAHLKQMLLGNTFKIAVFAHIWSGSVSKGIYNMFCCLELVQNHKKIVASRVAKISNRNKIDQEDQGHEEGIGNMQKQLVSCTFSAKFCNEIHYSNPNTPQ